MFESADETSFEELVRRVDARVVVARGAYEHATIRAVEHVYLRPTHATAQKDFVVLDSATYRAQMAAAQALFTRRKKTTGALVCELFVFVLKRGSDHGAMIRRATASRIVDATAAIYGFIADQPNVRVGEIARTHWVVHHPSVKRGGCRDAHQRHGPPNAEH